MMIMLRRAATTLPVRLRMRSLSTPPAVLPTTPDRNTPAENSAELFRSSPRPCMKKVGSQVKNSQPVQP